MTMIYIDAVDCIALWINFWLRESVLSKGIGDYCFKYIQLRPVAPLIHYANTEYRLIMTSYWWSSTMDLIVLNAQYRASWSVFIHLLNESGNVATNYIKNNIIWFLLTLQPLQVTAPSGFGSFRFRPFQVSALSCFGPSQWFCHVSAPFMLLQFMFRPPSCFGPSCFGPGRNGG